MSGKSSLRLINGVERKGKNAQGPIVIEPSPDVSFRVEAIGGHHVGAIAGSVLYKCWAGSVKSVAGCRSKFCRSIQPALYRLCIEVKVKIIERKDRK